MCALRYKPQPGSINHALLHVMQGEPELTRMSVRKRIKLARYTAHNTQTHANTLQATIPRLSLCFALLFVFDLCLCVQATSCQARSWNLRTVCLLCVVLCCVLLCVLCSCCTQSKHSHKHPNKQSKTTQNNKTNTTQGVCISGRCVQIQASAQHGVAKSHTSHDSGFWFVLFCIVLFSLFVCFVVVLLFACFYTTNQTGVPPLQQLNTYPTDTYVQHTNNTQQNNRSTQQTNTSTAQTSKTNNQTNERKQIKQVISRVGCDRER